jgi:hypothetical protein
MTSLLPSVSSTIAFSSLESMRTSSSNTKVSSMTSSVASSVASSMASSVVSPVVSYGKQISARLDFLQSPDWLRPAFWGRIKVFGAFFRGKISKYCSCVKVEAQRCRSQTVILLCSPRFCRTRLCTILYQVYSFNRSSSLVI